jgi:Flp pilus assembly pilin Flp
MGLRKRFLGPAEGIMLTSAKRLWHDEEGQDLTEYGLLLIQVGLGAVAAVKTFASAVSTLFSNASTSIGGS